MRILALTRYGRLGASSRLRTHQYTDFLAGKGIHLQCEPFFDDAYVQAMYGNGDRLSSVMRHFARRARVLASRSGADAVWLEKEVFPWLPWIVERAFLPRSMPLVVDCDDAIFHRYDRHPLGLVRMALGSKIDAVMRRADLVIAGSRYLADRARRAGACRVEVIATVVDLKRYPAARPKANAGATVIGWIGSPKTAPYLHSVERLLSRIPGISCVAIGAREDQVGGGPFVARPWSEASEVELLRGLDIGIMPLPDEPWTRGKCGYKLIQYMACGLPVVASPVGVNTHIVRHGENGFLASTEGQWVEALARLVARPDLRRRMGSAGRELVETKFSLQVLAPRLEGLLRSLIAC
jgi:glycosyltransferase involved in cell wall biosynthesis